MIKEIVSDEEFLSLPAEIATAEDAEVAQDLIDTINSMEDCACLAANMIGSRKAVIVYQDDKDENHIMYNPRIKFGKRSYKSTEGCFSLQRDSNVTRYQTIRVTYQELVDGELVNRDDEFTEWTAQAIQHAIDHCRGRLV